MFILILFSSGTVRAEDTSDKKFPFVKPMHLPFNLAGCFAEPRPDHFHSGIDIKTNGVEGEPVFAVYDGYISRIRVSPYGYGKALYITHPNGYTSVYGHLSRFNAAIEKYVHAQHYKRQQAELDLNLGPDVFPLKQNDTIAFSGNTGGSTAPHLHFEIRDSKTEYALNALDYYPKEFYIDTIPPQLNKVKVYQFDSLFYQSDTRIFPLEKSKGILRTSEAIPISGAHFCVSLEGFDKQDNSENKNGIQRMELWQDNSIRFKFDIRDIDFDNTRLCNAFVDYGEMMADKGYYYNCYRLKQNTLDIYQLPGRGFIPNDRDTQHVEIRCFDHNDNCSIVQLLFFRQTKSGTALVRKLPIHINYGAADSFVLKHFTLRFPANTFYDAVPLNGLVLMNKQDSLAEAFWVSAQGNAAMYKAATVEIQPLSKKNMDKMVIVVNNPGYGGETALDTKASGNFLYAATRLPGRFRVQLDTTGPSLKLLNFDNRDSIFSDHHIRVQMSDELSGIGTYKGFIDGHWVNFYYDAKNDELDYTFDEFCPPGEHTLKIFVSDKKENESILTQHFIHPKNP